MNIKNTSFFSPLIILFSLVLFRIIPHPPNFTPIIALVVSAYFFNNRVLAFFILALSLIISDFIIGFYDGFVLIISYYFSYYLPLRFYSKI